MPFHSKHRKLLFGIVLLLLGAGAVSYFTIPSEEPVVTTPEPESEETLSIHHEVIGASVEGRAIDAYTYGTGSIRLLFVGGIHGGYEWNSVLFAYELMDHFKEHPELIPSDLSITIVPSANPDGIYAVLGTEERFMAVDVSTDVPFGTGRFNANEVDLNRNFDCKWEPESTWRGEVVSAGTAPFSEPESQAIRDLVYAIDPIAVVFWHSQANAVYASECLAGILPATRTLMNTYATAAGYPSVDTFDAYAITGDAEGWLASLNIPAITVEFATHESIEWSKNLRGVEALIKHYSLEK